MILRNHVAQLSIKARLKLTYNIQTYYPTIIPQVNKQLNRNSKVELYALEFHFIVILFLERALSV